MSKLLLSPHNDDAELFACWTLLRHQPQVIVCLRSKVQEQYGITAEQREAETAAAMDILGIEWRQWPMLDSEPDWELAETWLNGWNADPYADHFGDIHVWAPAIEEGGWPHHNKIGELADLVFGYENVTHYLTYSGRPVVKSTVGIEVPYEDEWLILKHRALACYESQITGRTGSAIHFVEDLREFYAV
jgi:LmbE family N-acetylglucosaminyl deacetylase